MTDPQRRAAVVTAGSILLTGAAGCASHLAAPNNAGTTHAAGTTQTAGTTHAAAAHYMAIARPANRELDHEFDGLKHHEQDNLAGARADLRAAAATERHFDRQLMAISFPPSAGPVVLLLYRVNQARAALTSIAAGAVSLSQLRGYQQRLDAANEPVEDAVRVIRDQLGLPPPDTS